jgi:hypothetical protein
MTAAAAAAWIMAFMVNRVAAYKRWTHGEDSLVPGTHVRESEVR